MKGFTSLESFRLKYFIHIPLSALILVLLSGDFQNASASTVVQKIEHAVVERVTDVGEQMIDNVFNDDDDDSDDDNTNDDDAPNTSDDTGDATASDQAEDQQQEEEPVEDNNQIEIGLEDDEVVQSMSCKSVGKASGLERSGICTITFLNGTSRRFSTSVTKNDNRTYSLYIEDYYYLLSVIGDTLFDSAPSTQVEAQHKENPSAFDLHIAEIPAGSKNLPSIVQYFDSHTIR